MKNLGVLFLFFTLYSCVNKEFIEKQHYESGELRSSAFYKTKNDTIPFKKINFYKTGEVEDTSYYNSAGELEGFLYYYNMDGKYIRWAQYSKGNRNGKTIIKKKDGSQIIQFYKNDTLNGIEYQCNNNGQLLREVLWINDQALALKEINRPNIGDSVVNYIRTSNGVQRKVEFIDDSLTIHTYFKLQAEEIKAIGSLLFRNDEIVEGQIFNSYHQVIIAEKIISGEPLEIRVDGYFGNFGSSMDVYMEVVIGKELDQYFEPKNKVEVFRSEKGVLSLEFKINDYDIGYNLLLGKVNLKRDSTLLHECILFEDFEVVEN